MSESNSNKQYKRVPFDIELAKKIQSGEVEGNIKCVCGNSIQHIFSPRVLCYDRSNDYPIVVLCRNDVFSDIEEVITFRTDGISDAVCGKYELFIELPEETPKHELKVGDKVRIHYYPDEMFESYPELKNYQDKIVEIKRVVDGIETILFVANDEIKEHLINSAFVIPYNEKTPKHEFKPFDKVLVRDSPAWEWKVDLFSAHHPEKEQGAYVCVGGEFEYCIPYEGHEHLVGTTNNP